MSFEVSVLWLHYRLAILTLGGGFGSFFFLVICSSSSVHLGPPYNCCTTTPPYPHANVHLNKEAQQSEPTWCPVEHLPILADQIRFPQQSSTATFPALHSRHEPSWASGFHHAKPRENPHADTASAPAPSTWCSGRIFVTGMLRNRECLALHPPLYLSTGDPWGKRALQDYWSQIKLAGW